MCRQGHGGEVGLYMPGQPVKGIRDWPHIIRGRGSEIVHTLLPIGFTLLIDDGYLRIS